MRRLLAFYWLLRIERSLMVSVITGASAFAAGATPWRSAGMLLCGFLLAVGGFSLDLLADRALDRRAARGRMRRNPLAEGTLSPRAGLLFSIAFLVGSLVTTALLSPPSLAPWGGVLAVVVGLALHRFESALSRAVSLGLLQALYALMGAAAGRIAPALFLLAGMFFFAMFGGRGLTDLRDYADDAEGGISTLPHRFGVRRTARFIAASLAMAYALSLGAYFVGDFAPIYLYLDVAFVVLGIALGILILSRPSPRLGRVLTPVFMIGMGSLISLAMVLGRALAATAP